MDIDKLSDKIEAVQERVRAALKYKFQDDSRETEANEAVEDAIAAIENWLDLVVEDANQSGSSDENEEEEA